MTVARETQDEAAEVMRCLGESLRDPGFVTVLALLVAGKGGEENNLADSGAPESPAENGKGH
jgi:hypothetical protein